jgi:hypothetical protein
VTGVAPSLFSPHLRIIMRGGSFGWAAPTIRASDKLHPHSACPSYLQLFHSFNDPLDILKLQRQIHHHLCAQKLTWHLIRSSSQTIKRLPILLSPTGIGPCRDSTELVICKAKPHRHVCKLAHNFTATSPYNILDLDATSTTVLLTGAI